MGIAPVATLTLELTESRQRAGSISCTSGTCRPQDDRDRPKPTWFGVNVPKKLEKLWCGQAKCACAHASSFETTLTRLLRMRLIGRRCLLKLLPRTPPSSCEETAQAGVSKDGRREKLSNAIALPASFALRAAADKSHYHPALLVRSASSSLGWPSTASGPAGHRHSGLDTCRDRRGFPERRRDPDGQGRGFSRKWPPTA